MDTQSRPERAAQTILIVEEDEALRGILDHSLRHAGFAVGLASTVDEAFRRLDDGPDLVIAGASGLEICRRAKQLTDHLPPAVVLISEPGVESKTRGLEAGADDFVVKPIYVQEVVARAKALLQRRERERLELSASEAGGETGGERFVSDIADVPLVDLVRAVAAHQKSGVASITAPTGARGEIFFRQGNVVDAEVGRLSGRDAVYRLFCWTAGQLEVEWKSIRRKDIVETRPQELLIEALARVDEWQRLLAGLPALDTIFEVDYRMLAERLADIPDEVNRVLRLFDGGRTLLQVIDDSAMPDLHAAAIISRLCHERIIHDARLNDLRRRHRRQRHGRLAVRRRRTLPWAAANRARAVRCASRIAAGRAGAHDGALGPAGRGRTRRHRRRDEGAVHRSPERRRGGGAGALDRAPATRTASGGERRAGDVSTADASGAGRGGVVIVAASDRACARRSSIRGAAAEPAFATTPRCRRRRRTGSRPARSRFARPARARGTHRPPRSVWRTCARRTRDRSCARLNR